MNYKKAFITLYGAAGAALDELARGENAMTDIHVLKLREILLNGITQAEDITLAGTDETEILTLSA